MGIEVFSWEKTIEESLKRQIRRAKVMAKSKCNPDFNLAHVDETRDAQNGNYTKLINRITKEHNDRQARNKAKREKLGQRR